MDPLFVATPPEADIAKALLLWPELAGRRIRPLLVTAFGDIYVEADSGEVLVVDPIELRCERIADSVNELQRLFADPKWAQERLITEMVLLAQERGKTRAAHQVFSIAPHPCFSGKIMVEHLLPVDLPVWHHICAQLLSAQQSAQADSPAESGPVA